MALSTETSGVLKGRSKPHQVWILVATTILYGLATLFAVSRVSQNRKMAICALLCLHMHRWNLLWERFG